MLTPAMSGGLYAPTSTFPAIGGEVAPVTTAGRLAEVHQGGADPQLGGVVALGGGLDQIGAAVSVGPIDRMPSRRVPAHRQREEPAIRADFGQRRGDVHCRFR
ncbi:hypothetical protein MSHI_20900 [Mycobacterium shinjukuense]|uniref:Uncharacterized protein n=1 Tax=Mycobacterium shinjukuense TaxID=398694 RepID=A0A7I7MPI8_9MYCO|nr:hypothetical protein MSHI_20900 [Mycobacterium shinjukuense]